jgi:type II secretory pathway pseudopilin PulG
LISTKLDLIGRRFTSTAFFILPIFQVRRSFLIGEAAKIRWACLRHFRAGRNLRAFTVVELLIVVFALGILATVVIPQFSMAGQHARQNTLKDELQYLRTQVAVFKAQHQDVPPGYSAGNPASSPSAEQFAAQMTEHSNLKFQLSLSDSTSFPYGPYLKQVPANPVNGFCTLEMIGNNQPMPAPDGRTGWIYKPQTQELIANLTGKDDSGAAYSNY